jgi:hypothetical protein
MSEAREAVEQTLIHTQGALTFDGQADAVLEALRPIIAAEIRAWAETERRACPDYDFGGRETANNLTNDADLIASRICEGDQ